MRNRQFAAAIAGLGAAMSCAAATPQFSIEVLSDPAGSIYTLPNAISPTKGYIAGQGSDAITYAFKAVGWGPKRSGSLGATLGGDTNAMDVNDRGQFAGTSWSPDYSTSMATVWTLGKPTLLGSIHGGSTYAAGLDQAGDVVGLEYVATGYLPVVWRAGSPQSLPMPSGAYTGAMAGAISPNGAVIAGTAQDSNGYGHVVVWRDGTARVVSDPSAFIVNAIRVNDAGQVAALSFDWNVNAYPVRIEADGTTTRMPLLPGDLNGMPSAIDSHGTMVGYSSCQCAERVEHGVLWMNGKVYDLNNYLDAAARAAGWVVVTAYGIDEKGRIVVQGRQPGGYGVGLLLTPHN